MDVQLIVAVLSALVALLSIALSSRTSRSNAVLEARLQEEIEQRRDQASKAAQLEQVVSRYRDPLLSAAFDLQSRLFNIVDGGFVSYLHSDDTTERDYAVNSTLFVIAQYLGWTEALRRGVQFLDLRDVEHNRNLVSRLEAVRSVFSSETRLRGPFRIFRVEQRAIGELMLNTSDEKTADPTWRCQGYATFCVLLGNDQTFASWFARLGSNIRELATDAVPARARLVPLQHALLDLINFLDDPPLRFPANMRTRI